jgi:hypothetical protein
MEKILIAEMKDADGVKVLYAITDVVYLKDIEAQVRTDLDFARTVSVKFYYRTKKWLDSKPEYTG